MSANIKIGNDTLQGVNAVELENADALGSYVKFTLGSGIEGGYTVTFVAEGNPYTIISVIAGSAIEEPIPPEVTGLLTGWSTDEAGTNLVSFPYTPTADITLYAKVSPKKTLEESTWAEIAQVSANKQWNAMGWKVGDSKTITLNGTVGTLALNNYQCKVYIIGFDHNAEKEGQGISFGMLEGVNGKQLCLVDQYYNTGTAEVMAFSMNTSQTNAGGWKAATMRKTILGSTDVENGDATPETISNPAANTLMAALPADLRAVLKPITKYTNNVGNSGDASAISTTIDYLPLMAEFEVFGVQTHANSNEKTYQAQYEYYKSGKSKIKYKQNDVASAAHWWLRSPYSSNSNSFCFVSAKGTFNYSTAVYSLGVAPAFLV
ncbi:MAG: InlB B-repeat-containing protein [Ruminococcus sp.]|nr:InlB B-repeat-containing protein [Ruminococcus sp.]